MKKNLKAENKVLKAKLLEMELAVEHFALFWELAGYIRRIPILSWLMVKTVKVIRWVFKRVKHIEIVDNVKSPNPEMIGICHPKFRGVRSATSSLVSDLIEVPEIYDAKQLENVVRLVEKYKPKTILISGYPKGYDILVKQIKKSSPNVRVLFLSHASFTWYNLNLDEEKMLEKMLNLHEKGLIEKVGFVKKDNAEYFKRLGMNSFYVMNRFNSDKVEVRKPNLLSPNIGVFGSNMWHRNLLNQVIAGTLVDGSTVHVNELGYYSFLKNCKIVRHGLLPKEKFDKLFESMDVNLYVSFTDCFPMSIVESMSSGIPCIASYTSDVYSFSPYLREKLIITKIDSPIAISEKIKEVIKDYEKIQAEIKKYLPILKKEVENSIQEFLK